MNATKSQIWGFKCEWDKISNLGIQMWMRQNLKFGDSNVNATKSQIWGFKCECHKISNLGIQMWMPQNLKFGDSNAYDVDWCDLPVMLAQKIK